MKILSWNAQGYAGQMDKSVIISNLLNTGEYDLICIQEAGDALGRFDQIKKDGNPKILECKQSSHQREVYQLHNYYAIYYRWGDTNYRCSLVTYVKKCLYSESSVYIPPMIRNIRGGLITTINTVYGLVNVCNIHLYSGNPDFAWQQFQEILVNMQGATYPFIIIGDFNIDSRTIGSRTIGSRTIAVHYFYSVGSSTQISGGCLDYAYSEHFRPYQMGKLCEPGVYSDHSPVCYIFKPI